MAGELGLPLLRSPSSAASPRWPGRSPPTKTRCGPTATTQTRGSATLDAVYVAGPLTRRPKPRPSTPCGSNHLLATLPGAPGRQKPAGMSTTPRTDGAHPDSPSKTCGERGPALAHQRGVIRLMQRYMERSGTTHWMISNADWRAGARQSPPVNGLFAREVMQPSRSSHW